MAVAARRTGGLVVVFPAREQCAYAVLADAFDYEDEVWKADADG